MTRLLFLVFLEFDLVAGCIAFGLVLLAAEPAHVVVRSLDFRVRNDHHGGPETGFYGVDLVALLIKQVRCSFNRKVDMQRCGVLLHRLFLDVAQHVQRRGLDTAYMSGTVAARADQRARFSQRGAQPLARHLEQPETRNAANLHARPIGFQSLDQLVLHGALVACRSHVDKVDHDQTAQIAQP